MPLLATDYVDIIFESQASHIITDHVPECPQLTSIYGSHMINIGKKLQLKMYAILLFVFLPASTQHSVSILSRDPSIKRSICKGCKGLLIPGLTAKVQIQSTSKQITEKKKKKKKQKHFKTQVWTCQQCKCVRNFVLNPKFLLWSEKCHNWKSHDLTMKFIKLIHDNRWNFVWLWPLNCILGNVSDLQP